MQWRQNFLLADSELVNQVSTDNRNQCNTFWIKTFAQTERAHSNSDTRHAEKRIAKTRGKRADNAAQRNIAMRHPVPHITHPSHAGYRSGAFTTTEVGVRGEAEARFARSLSLRKLAVGQRRCARFLKSKSVPHGSKEQSY